MDITILFKSGQKVVLKKVKTFNTKRDTAEGRFTEVEWEMLPGHKHSIQSLDPAQIEAVFRGKV